MMIKQVHASVFSLCLFAVLPWASSFRTRLRRRQRETIEDCTSAGSDRASARRLCMASCPSWEETWPEAEAALAEAAREHAQILGKERSLRMAAQRHARASEKAALQKIQGNLRLVGGLCARPG